MSFKPEKGNINEGMFFTVFSSALLLQWYLSFTWSEYIWEMANHKGYSVWTQQGLPDQSRPCDIS